MKNQENPILFLRLQVRTFKIKLSALPMYIERTTIPSMGHDKFVLDRGLQLIDVSANNETNSSFIFGIGIIL